MKNNPAILFVCTANICRSPMAAALLCARLQKELPDGKEWQVDSAGTWALEGEMAAKYSRQVMGERGIDITSHRARTVTGEMLKQYSLILTMEPGQKEALQVEFPSVAGRVYLLGEMDESGLPVDDPYGGPVEGYQKSADNIDQMLAKGMQRIIHLASKNMPKSD